ncbi:MAG: isoleucine--tRNA ligase [Nitrospirales bacterium]|nr:isoleucine--tRNA ligase [Nitrospira sp.]MDR4501739.1 isoleucine--tRNA ligase [Nitrospirales bacterium]
MDYKSTLNLPQTDFPMKANLPQREPRLLAWWAEQRLYHKIQEARSGHPLYLLHDGPPYANGKIHIGHALNKILKDIIIKSKTMAGYRVPYVPGWDCHGLPIEHQVAKQLGEKKKHLSAVELRQMCRDYAGKFYRIQREEFERLGVFGDWERPYLTMDKAYEADIVQEFGKFVEKGGVYKGLKPVLWCTTDQTALAEAEVEYEDHSSPSIFVKFPFERSPKELASGSVFGLPLLAEASQVSIVIWTTTPWTLPANQAIAIHPDLAYAFVRVGDEVLVVAEELVEQVAKTCQWSDYHVLGVKKGNEQFEGLLCSRPLTTGSSPVLLGDFVTLEQGTGCVHIAPGHGMEDYLLALKYNQAPHNSVLHERLQILVPVDHAGRFKQDVEDFSGQPVLKANPDIVDKLEKLGVLVGQGTVEHSYPHCWRCKNPVIFRATEQWFVSMEEGELRSRALKEIDHVRWFPERGRDRIYGMVLNRPDWCLSRQRIWGTPIPGFTCTACGKTLADTEVIAHIVGLVRQHGADVWFEKPVDELLPNGTACPSCGGTKFTKEQDILDVWFESGVSHAAVLKARDANWWPADLYLEGSDQHRGWFHSALLASVTTDGRAPYKAVLTHGFVVDGHGKKMSKSAGNVVAPQDVISQSGADILRLWVASQDYQEDLRISQDILRQMVDAYRKIRNTSRFLLSNLYDFDPLQHRIPYSDLSGIDRWALLRLARMSAAIQKAYDDFDFRQAIHELDYFCSVDMSATYLDVLKDRLYTFPKNSTLRRGAQTVILEIVIALSKCMAPILSFTSEEIWQALPKNAIQGVDSFSVHVSSFPEPDSSWMNADLEREWDSLLAIRTIVQGALEKLRREKVIGAPLEAQVSIRATAKHYDLLKRHESELPALFIVSHVRVNQEQAFVADDGFVSDRELEIMVDVTKAQGNKCERCWNYRSAVGADAEHPNLCDRCLEAIKVCA